MNKLAEKLAVLKNKTVELQSTTLKKDKFNFITEIQKYTILDKMTGAEVLFRPNKFQRRLNAVIRLLEEFKIPVRIVILKSRKLGFSTNVQLVFFAKNQNIPNRTALTIAHNTKSTTQIHMISAMAWKSLPDSEKKPLVKGEAGKEEIKCLPPHNSIMHCMTAGGGQIGRGFTPRDIHASEMAFWDNDDVVWTAVMNSITKGARDTCIIVESTANGAGNLFYRLWQNSYKPERPYALYKKLKQGYRGWIGLFFSWLEDENCQIPLEEGEELIYDHVERAFAESHNLTPEQMKWVREIVQQDFLGNWTLFHQEFPATPDLAFQFSGFPLFDQRSIEILLDEADKHPPIYQGDIILADTDLVKPVLTEFDKYGRLFIWDYPCEDHRYALSVDCSEGIGSDFAEIGVWQDWPPALVAYWYSNETGVSETAVKAYLLGAYYNWALIGVERNGLGVGCISVLREGHIDYPQLAEYPNLYYHEYKDRKTKEIITRIGFQTYESAKKMGIDHLRETLLKRNPKIYSKRVLNQLKGFTFVPGRSGPKKYQQKTIDPETGAKCDDAVMMAIIGEEMRREVLKRKDTKLKWFWSF